MSRILRMLIMGPPGSGKGTISIRIVRDFKFEYLSSGDLLRSHIEDGTSEGKAAEVYINQGSLVPDHLLTNLIFKEVERIGNEKILLDGYPRTIQQAELISKKIDFDSVINLKVPDEVIIERLRGRWVHISSGRIYHTEFRPPKKRGLDDYTGEALVQRPDDMPETVKARLQNYHKLTQPLQEYYADKKILHHFTGKNSNEIWTYVKAYLNENVGPAWHIEN